MSESDAPDDDPAAFEAQLDDIATALDAAETEADLDDVEEGLDAIETDLDEADFPEPDVEDEDEEEEPPDPREELADRIDDLRGAIDDQRGPYADEVVNAIEGTISTIETTEWATEGVDEVVEVVNEALDEFGTTLDTTFERVGESDEKEAADRLGDVTDAVENAGLHPDDDTPTIEALLEAANTLTQGIEDATAFGDLEVREQLHRKGFFDVLGHYKDFPPEWSALKVHQEERNVEMILLAFDLLDSNFMEEHCVAILRRLGDPAALDAMVPLAKRRDKDAIDVLGKIGDPEPVDMLADYTEADSDPLLQQVSLKTLGEIGDTEATAAVAQQLHADDATVRSVAARSLGKIGDPRAIDPLVDILSEDPEEAVRGSAAWALLQIGTRESIDALSEYDADDSYLVEYEVNRAVG